MEQLRVEVQKYIDGKPQGHPYYLHKNFRLHVRDHRWVIVEGLEGSDTRCRVAEQDVRAIRPAFSVVQPSVANPLKPKTWLPLEHERRKQRNDTPKDITT
jgi:hypothetical protein